MSNTVRSTSLTWKLMLAPGLVAVLLLIYGVFSFYSLSTMQKSISELNSAVNAERLAQEAEATVNAMHSVMYRGIAMVKVKDKDRDEKSVKAARNMTFRQLSVVNDLRFSLSTVSDERMKKTIQLYNSYAKTMKEAQELVATEPSQAMSLVHETDATYDALIQELVAVGAESRIHAEAVREQLADDISSLEKIQLALLVAAIVVGLGAAYAVGQRIIRPLRNMQARLVTIEQSNNFALRVDVTSRDEVGQTAQSLNALLATLQQAVSEVNSVMASVAAGDLSVRVTAQLHGDMGQMKQSLNDSLSTVQLTMTSLSGALSALEAGHFDHRMEVSGLCGDFLKNIQQAQSSLGALHAMISDVGHVMQKVARGELTQDVTAQGQGDLQQLKSNINQSLSALRASLTTINHNARQVAAASSQSSQAIGQISDGAQNQTHAISQIAVAMRQTSATVTDVSRNTEQASQNSRASMQRVRESMVKMKDMVGVVENMASNSEKINKITEVIESIANKTNLLSLNAAIEAARAGEHGKGFAVVADEVGKLAINSAESSKEIAILVKQAVEQARLTLTAVTQVHQDMGQLEQGSQATDEMLERIASALEEQTAAVEEINANLGSVQHIAQSNSAASEEIAATVIELSKIADATHQEVRKFNF